MCNYSLIIDLIIVSGFIITLITFFQDRKERKEKENNKINKILCELESWTNENNDNRLSSVVKDKGELNDTYNEMINKRKYKKLHTVIEAYYKSRKGRNFKKDLKDNVKKEIEKVKNVKDNRSCLRNL